MSEEYGGRDRLRELLDAVLDEDNHSLGEMAQDMFDDRQGFDAARRAFVHKQPPERTPSRLALHRAPGFVRD